MKKIIALFVIFSIGLIQSCICPNKGFSLTHITIESARGIFYSFSETDIFPYFDSFDRSKLGISVFSDSTSERIEVAQLFPALLNSAYACENPSRTEYVNFIDSVSVVTVYDFDVAHPAGSNVNDILNPMDNMAETTSVDNIQELTFIDQNFKFSAIPTADSMQFVITGRISEKGTFSIQTDLVVLPK